MTHPIVSDELVEKAAEVAWEHNLPSYYIEGDDAERSTTFEPVPHWGEADEADREYTRATMCAALEAVAGDMRKQVLTEAVDAAVGKYMPRASGPAMDAYNQGVTDARLAVLALLEGGAGDGE